MSLLRLFILLLSASPLLSGCYLMHAANGQMVIVNKRRPIDAVIVDPQTTPKLRGKLEYVAAARAYASRDLGLPDNDSYRSYVDLARPYVVWNVFATPEFSVEPKRWCFPIAGCVVYRGYFNEPAAQRYARRLRGRDYDVSIGGVPAYSTLGHFKDPVLNTMLGWTDAQLAATLFHELAHQVVYVPGDSEFNEAFATVVEETGVERWLQSRGQADALQAWRTQRRRHLRFIELLLATREELAALYASELSSEEMSARKQYTFGRLKLDYGELKREWGGFAGYDAWFSRTLNNADLASAATYYTCAPGLQRLLGSVGGDLPRFYQAARELAAETAEKRAQQVCSDPGTR